MKVSFLIYLFLPQTQGAKVVYENVIRPYVVPHIVGTEAPAKKVD
jgi:hypothetical protein